MTYSLDELKSEKSKTIQEIEKAGAIGARTLNELTAALSSPKIVWVMVPAGEPTNSTIQDLAERLSPGDIIIDGGWGSRSCRNN